MGKWLRITQKCDVTIAANGKIGLDFLKRFRYDVCFMDFLMPVMSGVEAMEAFQHYVRDTNTHTTTTNPSVSVSRQDRERNKDMLLVGFSANASDKDLEQAFLGGKCCMQLLLCLHYHYPFYRHS